ncbi:MAG: DUF6089 family protein, partial [Cyclobacteriaceae bacterium]
ITDYLITRLPFTRLPDYPQPAPIKENNQLAKFAPNPYISVKFCPDPKMKRLYLLTSLLVALTLYAEAQSFYAIRRDRSLIALGGLNTSTYYGDLKDDSDIIDAKPSLSLGLMTSITKRINVRGEFSWVTLSGKDEESSDPGKTGRNLSFSSSSYEFNVSGVVNFVEQKGNRFYQRSNFNGYVFAGIGGLYFNPKASLEGQKYALQPLQTEGIKYGRFAFVIPFGIGGKIKLTPFINLAIEAGWRKTFTDYIDDVSTTFVANASFTDPIAKQLADRRPEINLPVFPAGNKRGDPSNKDAYMLLSAKIEYYLPFQLGNQGRKLYNRKRKASYR